MRTLYAKIQSVQTCLFMDMVNINLMCLIIICLCFIGVFSESQEPWIWPVTYVYDGNPMIEFTCGAYLKAGESLTWYREEPRPKEKSSLSVCTVIVQKYDGYTTLQLIWPLAILPSGSKMFCVKRVPVFNSGTTTWNTTRRDINPIIFQKDRIAPLTDDMGPWLTPDTFVEGGGSVIEFSCWAYLFVGELLSWYRMQDSNHRARLTMVQQKTLYGYMKIKLRKTLEPSDNGTQIYCVKDKEKGEVKESQRRILIEFQREIKHVDTYVTVEPSVDIVFFEEGDELEFVCGGSEPAAGRALTWYSQAPGFRQLQCPRQSYHKSTNKNHLTLSVEVAHHQSVIYCAQDFKFKFLNGSILSYGGRKRSQMITLLHRGQSDPGEQPQVAPKKFVDNRRPFLQFTCYMFLQPGQILSWYQSKGSTHADDSLIRLVQLEYPRAKGGEWVVLTLNKTLEPEDNGSEIYCARHTVLQDGSFLRVLKESERIPLTFYRDIPPLVNAFITVEPNNTDICFNINTTLRLTCTGSKPVDGRNYTWLKKDSESGLTVLEGQKYDQTTNLNVLEMSLNETHHLNRLVCVLGFVSYIRLSDGSQRCKIYGQLTEPKTITLIRREKSSTEKQTTYHTIPAETYGTLAVAILLAVTALVTSAVACCVLRRSRSGPPAATAPPAPTATVDNYGQYASNVPSEVASPQVTYAVLDLPQPARRAKLAPAPDTALYAEICKQ